MIYAFFSRNSKNKNNKKKKNRELGLKVSILFNKSKPTGFALGYKVWKLCLLLFGSDFMYFSALSLPM
jgi:hypothetical protein